MCKRAWSRGRIISDPRSHPQVNDRVILRATITVWGAVTTTVARAFHPAPTLGTDLGRLLASGDGADIEIYVGGQTFPVHRAHLRARSPYFKALFSSSMRDADSDGISIVDTEAPVFEQLLNWIYTDEVEDESLSTMGEAMLMGANRYELGPLKQTCEAKLCVSARPCRGHIFAFGSQL